MKKICFKVFLAALFVSGISSCFVSCSDKDDEITYLISLNQLPDDAQSFLNEFFYNIDADSVERQSIGKVVMYKVNLDNGFMIMFNSDGEWQEVDAPDGKIIPSGIAPEAIEKYVSEEFPDYGINEINKTGDGYNVEINGNVRLTFNELGECTGTFQDY